MTQIFFFVSKSGNRDNTAYRYIISCRQECFVQGQKNGNILVKLDSNPQLVGGKIVYFIYNV